MGYNNPLWPLYIQLIDRYTTKSGKIDYLYSTRPQTLNTNVRMRN